MRTTRGRDEETMSGDVWTSSALSDRGVAFDPESGELSGPEGTTRLAPQPADLFALLVEEAGNVVSRTRIRARLWPGGRVDFDQGIAFAVREIRRGLEDVGVDSGLLETLPRRGFRVAAAEGSGGARPRRVRWGSMALGLVLGLVAGVLFIRFIPLGGTRTQPVVAVFPHDPGEAVPATEPVALAEALTARLTSALAGEVGVVGPSGTAGLDSPNDAEGARAALGACLLLSGSLRQAGPDSLLVFTQIIRTSDRVHVWARRDTLRSGEVAARVAEAAVASVRAALQEC
jgi:TolB-like protein